MAILGRPKVGKSAAAQPVSRGKVSGGSTPFSSRLSFRLTQRPGPSPMNSAFQMANANFPYPGFSSIQGFGKFGQYGQ